MKQLFVFFLFLLTISLNAQITAQWRGTERDGIYPANNLLEEWPETGPALLWHAEGIGKGFSSAVSDGKYVFVTGMKDSSDVMTCLSMDGKIRWQKPFGRAWKGPFPETRTTPTVDRNRVYAISGFGTIACLETETGNILWSVDGLSSFEGVHGTWGVCESPLIHGDHLIYTPAGPKTTMVALDKITGKLAWESETINDTSAYVSPRVIRQGGREIIVTLAERYFFGVDATNGKILWKYDYASLKPEKGLAIWPGAPRTNTITPQFGDGMLYITGGYDHVGSMFRLSSKGDSVTQVWIDSTLDCHHGGVVKVGNYIYGSNWIDNSRGNWCCLEWTTGKKMFEQKWFTKGAIIAAGNMLYCFDEKEGNLGLVHASPGKFDLVSSFKVPLGKGQFWAHPFIQGGNLLIRHGDVVMAYDISKK